MAIRAKEIKGFLKAAQLASLLRYAPVAHPGLHICLSLWTCAIARVFSAALRLPPYFGCPPWATHLSLPLDQCAFALVFAPAHLALSGQPSVVFDLHRPRCCALRANLRLVYLQLSRACDSRTCPGARLSKNSVCWHLLLPVNHENLAHLVTFPFLCPLNTKKENKSGLTPSGNLQKSTAAAPSPLRANCSGFFIHHSPMVKVGNLSLRCRSDLPPAVGVDS